MEHSLISVSKWEAIWNKPFLTNTEKTFDETLSYIKCMTVTGNVKPEVYLGLTLDNFKEIFDYINAPMTATTLPKDMTSKGKKRVVTSELIYYWMVALNIPFECEKWHLSRLLMLIGVCNVENAPNKKMSRKETASHYAALNAARRKKFKSKG